MLRSAILPLAPVAGMDRRTRVVYAVLAAVWALMVAWQVLEHSRVKRAARAALMDRAKDISNTVGLVLKSQRHVITKERLESALNSLVKPDELNAVAMLSVAGDIIAQAGAPVDLQKMTLAATGEHWGARSLEVMNLVDLGGNITSEAETRIVVPEEELFRNRGGTNRPPPEPRPGRPPAPREGASTNETGPTPGPADSATAS